MKRDNCGGCQHLAVTDCVFKIVHCSKTEFIVPHHADYINDSLTLHRVPEACPLSDDEVQKNPDGYVSANPHKMRLSEVKSV